MAIKTSAHMGSLLARVNRGVSANSLILACKLEKEAAGEMQAYLAKYVMSEA